MTTTETTLESNHENEAVDVSTVEEVSTVAETNSKPAKKKRTRRPTPPGAELMMQTIVERQAYNLAKDEEYVRLFLDLANSTGDAILDGEVFCDNPDIMTKLLLLSFVKKEIAAKS